METVNIILGAGCSIVKNNGEITFTIDSIDNLKKFLSDAKSIINYDKEIEYIRKSVELDNTILVDGYGNEIEEFSNIDSQFFSIKERNIEEKKRLFETLKKHFDSYYNNLVSGNYKFGKISVANDNYFFQDEIVDTIALVKDKVETIDISPLDINDLFDLINRLDISEKVKIATRYNSGDTSTKGEIIELFNYLNNIKSFVKKYNFSQLESCIFVYDLVREKKYRESDTENDNEIKALHYEDMNKNEKEEFLESASVSRSLMKIYKSDEIVCTGFSKLYSAILQFIGINANTIEYNIEEEIVGHTSNIVYLTDDKYGIRGVFEVDTTWGRHYNDDGTYDYKKSLNDYTVFAKSLNLAYKIKETEKLVESTNNLDVHILLKRLARVKQCLELGAPSVILRNIVTNLHDVVVETNIKFYGEYLFKEMLILDGYINEFEEVDTKLLTKAVDSIEKKILYSSIDKNTFMNALYNVKLVEHSIDKDKYPLTIDEYIAGSASMFLKKVDSFLPEGYIASFSEEKKLDIARAELLSVLHNKLNDGINNNPIQYVKK